MITIYYSKDFYLHAPPRGGYHPENPSRLDIVLTALRENGFEKNIIEVREAEPKVAVRELLSKIHDNSYVEYILRLCEQGFEGYLDGDTYVCKNTCRAALKAVELTAIATEHALEKPSELFFVLPRPPGHHAGASGSAMGAPTLGFCIFNNIAAGAAYARLKGFKPILIIDVDVHHGNGTQEIFWSNPNVIHIDLHEWGIYPGTGSVDDIGGKGAEGTKVNIPLLPGAGDEDYIYIFLKLVEPLIYAIKPRLIAVSAGFDAYAGDGLAYMRLTEKFYEFFGKTLYDISKALGVGVVAVLEGGYSIGLRNGLPAVLKGFSKPEYTRPSLESVKPSENVKNVVDKVIRMLRPYVAI
jgi:acetoin utilization deacetylase AcuC-like enzyme